ncbi:MAG: polysaccharide biosynthesis tyrosine autokinase [Clostridia bacterium]|nr:polysaccharide biosynthesis tyrosine autokinase [Clostridia bacterium]
MENTKEKEITLKTLFDVLKKCYIVMIIASVLLASAAAAFVAVLVKPTYRANATFWVSSSSASYDYASQAMTAAASAIASSCVELVSEDLPVRRAVQYGNLTEKLGYENENECVRAVRKMVTATKKETGSFIFYITVNGERKEDVAEIAMSLKAVMPEVMTDLLKLKQNENNASILTSISSPDEADVITVKTSPIKVFALVAVVVAMLTYLVYFVISIFDTVVYGEATVKENFDHPILGNIPSFDDGAGAKAARGRRGKKKNAFVRDYTGRLLTKATPFGLTEAFNQLRTNIIFSAGDNRGSAVGITSAQSGEGKSLLSANLAYALSNLGKRVLLVETDMRLPVLNKVFKVDATAGLSELIAGIESDYKSVTVRVMDGAYDVILSGKIPPNPSELLSSPTMRELVGAWREAYDFVIFDMPPVGEVIDASAVADTIDGYAIAVRCDYSDIGEVRRAVDFIEGVGGKIFGFVINDNNPKQGKSYKRHYYGGGARYGRATAEDK